MQNLPTILINSPIKESTFEVRFESAFPAGAIFGIAYNALKETYKDSQSLPILQIPESVRLADPNLIFQPYYRLNRDQFTLQIGPKIVSITAIGPYCGWKQYRQEILDVFDRLGQLDFISEVSRIGLRYVNLFKSSILDDIKFEIRINESIISNPETTIRTVFPEENNFKTLLQIANEVVVTEADGSTYTGSLIDIDVSIDGNGLPPVDKMVDMIDQAHSIEKSRFFELLKDEFLTTFEPVYGEKK